MKKSVTVFAFLFFVICLYGSIIHWGNWHFGAYDLSVHVDVAWRLYQGQKPHIDFICTLPPLFYLLAYESYRLFGVHWDSLLWINFFYTLFHVLVSLRLMKKFNWEPLLQVAYLVGVLLGMGVTSHLHHSTVTTITTITFFLLSIDFQKPSKENSVSFLFIFMVALMFLGKPNVAWPFLLFSGLYFFYLYPKRAFLHYTAGFTLGCFLLWCYGVHPFSYIKSYFGVSGRGYPDKFITSDIYRLKELYQLTQLLYVFHLIPAVFLFLSLVHLKRWRNFIKKEKGFVVLSFILMLCGVLGLGTNADIKTSDFPLFLMGSVPLFLFFYKKSWEYKFSRILVLLSLFFYFYSFLTLGGKRARNLGAGKGTFYEESYSNKKFKESYFSNLHTGPRMHHVMKDVRQVLSQYQNRKPVFFGPRMEFLYAVHKEPSPKNLPIWWHPETSFIPGKGILEAWKENKFEILIFLKNDYTRIPSSIRRQMEKDFVLKNRKYTNLSVWFRKDGKDF